MSPNEVKGAIQHSFPPTTDVSNGAKTLKKHPCNRCQQRKVKCDRLDPCCNCARAHVECLQAEAPPPRRKRRRFPQEELLARLRRYEEHLRRHGVNIDAINSEAGDTVTFDPPTSTTATILPKADSSATTPNKAPKSLPIRRSFGNVKNMWTGMSEEFRDAEELLQGESEDEICDAPITRTFDGIGTDGVDILFASQPLQNLVDLHPSPVHIFRLWQTFLDNVNPLIKIFHAPSVQHQILDASANLKNIPKGLEALMFSIYAFAVSSLNDDQSIDMFGEDRIALLTRFQTGARHALLAAGFLRSSETVVLQAFVLYLHSSMSIDPRSLFCLTGVAVRIAQRMGLHHDGTSYGLPPFEVEMRRRLWWQIVLLDNRIAEVSGAGNSILTHTWTTNFPSNMNDNDLFADMRDLPAESTGLTEMVFFLLRCEVAHFAQTSSPAAGSLTAHEHLINEFEDRIEHKYLQKCDPLIPLHLMAITMGRSSLCKLRMATRSPCTLLDRGVPILQEERDRLFVLGLEMFEYHKTMMASKNLSKFLWYSFKNSPLAAEVYILCELRHRPIGKLADRAWQQFAERSEYRRKPQFSRNPMKKSPLNLAFANLTVKAWDAREHALLKVQSEVRTPVFIAELRDQLPVKGVKKSATCTGETVGNTSSDGFTNQLDPQHQWPGYSPFDQSQQYNPLISGSMPSELSPMDWLFWNDLGEAGQVQSFGV